MMEMISGNWLDTAQLTKDRIDAYRYGRMGSFGFGRKASFRMPSYRALASSRLLSQAREHEDSSRAEQPTYPEKLATGQTENRPTERGRPAVRDVQNSCPSWDPPGTPPDFKIGDFSEINALHHLTPNPSKRKRERTILKVEQRYGMQIKEDNASAAKPSPKRASS